MAAFPPPVPSGRRLQSMPSAPPLRQRPAAASPAQRWLVTLAAWVGLGFYGVMAIASWTAHIDRRGREYETEDIGALLPVVTFVGSMVGSIVAGLAIVAVLLAIVRSDAVASMNIVVGSVAMSVFWLGGGLYPRWLGWPYGVLDPAWVLVAILLFVSGLRARRASVWR